MSRTIKIAKLKFEELSNDAKEKAKDNLIGHICQNEIPFNLRFDEEGYVSQFGVSENK